MRILDKYIISETLPVFIIANVFSVFLLLMDKILDLADLFFTRGIPGVIIIQTILYYLPSFLVITIPISALFAMLLTFGRLSGDSEIVAMRAAGAGYGAMLRPTIVVGTAAVLLGVLMSTYLMPLGSRLAVDNINMMTKMVSVEGMREKELYEEIPGLVFYTEGRKDDGSYERMIIIDKKTDNVITAETGTFDSGSQGLNIKLNNGRIVTTGEKGRHSIVRFRDMNYAIPPIGDADISLKEERTMTLEDLKSNFETPLYRYEYSKRFSLPFAALIMAVFGMALGIFSSRTGRSFGVPLSIALVATYNMLIYSTENLAETGRIEPFTGAWIANAVFAAISIYFIRRTMR